MNSLDEIKHYIIQNFKLEELIGEDTDIKKSGTRLSACCPFHEENTPSFYIFSDHYHCFGCKAHGDVINYVREKRGLGFLEAIEFLGGKLGVDTSGIRQNKQDRAHWEKKSRAEKAYQIAQQFFIKALYGPFGKTAYKYILSRGYTDQQIKDYGFGFSLNSPSALSGHLLERGFSKEELEELSLSNTNGKDVYDFFRGRLMIPIRDVTGKFIAFAGRTILDSPQKYKNSRFDKKSYLFGLDHAHKQIKRKGRALVVEGYLDAIRLWSLGLHETVACQGTALTGEHMKKLKGLSKEVYLVFDGDKAGKQAALKTISESQKTEGVSFYYVALPEGEDPDSYTKKHGVPALESLIEKAPPLIEFVITERFQTTPEQRTPELLRQEIIPWIKETKDPIERAYFLKKVVELSGISSEILLEELAKPSSQVIKEKPLAPKIIEPSKKIETKIETKKIPIKNFKLKAYLKDLMGHLYFVGSAEEINLKEIEDVYHQTLELPEPWGPFFEELLSSLKNFTEAPFEKGIHTWASSYSPEIINFLEALKEKKEAFDCSDRKERLKELLLFHEKELLKEKISILKIEIKKSPKGQSHTPKMEIISKISQLHKQLMTLQEH